MLLLLPRLLDKALVRRGLAPLDLVARNADLRVGRSAHFILFALFLGSAHSSFLSCFLDAR